MTPKHPFQTPSEQLLDAGDGPVRQTRPDPPGPLAVVLSVTSVTGGQRITFREQTSTSRANATPRDADNPYIGEAMVPSAVGTVAVNDLVTTLTLPGRDELVAIPSSGGGSFITSVGIADLMTSPVGTVVEMGSIAFPVDGQYYVWGSVEGVLAFNTNGIIGSANVAFWLGYGLGPSDIFTSPGYLARAFGGAAPLSTVGPVATGTMSVFGYANTVLGNTLRLLAARQETGAPAATWSQVSLTGQFGAHQI